MLQGGVCLYGREAYAHLPSYSILAEEWTSKGMTSKPNDPASQCEIDPIKPLAIGSVCSRPEPLKSGQALTSIFLALLAMLAGLLGTPQVCAGTVTWVGGSGAWEVPMNWSPQVVPGSGDAAVVNGNDTVTISVTGGQSVDTLVLDNPNATLRIHGGRFSPGVQFTVANGFENRGIIELDNDGSANGIILTVGSGTLTNALGGIIRVPESSTNGHRRLEATLDNRGTIEVGADLYLLGNVANSGTVHIPG